MKDAFQKYIIAADRSLQKGEFACALNHYHRAISLMLSLEQSRTLLEANRDRLGELFLRSGLAALAEGLELNAVANMSAALAVHENRRVVLCILATIRAVSHDYSVRDLASAFYCARLSECGPPASNALSGFVRATLALTLCNSTGFDEARESLQAIPRSDLHEIPGIAAIAAAVESRTMVTAEALVGQTWIMEVLQLE